MGSNSGKLYMTDETAVLFGGRDIANSVYDRIDEGGFIILTSESDSASEILNMFMQAKHDALGSDAIAPEVVLQGVSNNPVNPGSILALDSDADNQLDISISNPVSLDFEAILRSQPETERLFILGHEIGHHNTTLQIYAPDTLGNRNHTETLGGEIIADLNGLKGIGDLATDDFKKDLLSMRAGEGMGLIFPTAFFRSFMPEGSFGPDAPFNHMTTGAIFLDTEERYVTDTTTLMASYVDISDKVISRAYDNQLSENPNFSLNLENTTLYQLGNILTNIEGKLDGNGQINGDDISAFTDNINSAKDAVETALQTLKIASFTPGAEGDIAQLTAAANQAASAYRLETQMTMDYLRDRHPETYKDLIIEGNFAMFMEQTGESSDITAAYGPGATLEIVQELSAEGAFDNDPTQQRIAQYFEQDATFRPEKYSPATNDATLTDATNELEITQTPIKP